MVKKVFLFSGQGSQYVGMGKKLCENYKVASDMFDEASEALGFDLKKLCQQGTMEELTLTYNAQPAILTTSAAMFKVCMENDGIKPDILAGHSLGEISALTCAGAIAFPDAVKIARKRGEFMQEAVKPGEGAMYAVMTRDEEKVHDICKEISTSESFVGISNYNSRTQIVISGNVAAVEHAAKVLEGEDIKVKQLKVSAPFHCPLMQPAADKLKEELQKYTFSDLLYPVLSNYTAKPYIGIDVIIDNLAAQLVNPVRWSDSMTYLKKAMIEYGVEMGPGYVLKNMMKTNISDIRIFSYDNTTDINKLKEHIKNSYIPFLTRSMGIAVATRNTNWDSDEYQKGVIEPYSKIESLNQKVEMENREPSKEEMDQAIDMLLSVFKTKHTSIEERKKRLQELFADTGTEEVYKDFDYSVIQ